MIRLAILTFAILALPFLARAEQMIPVTYHCERGVELPVIYLNSEDGKNMLVAVMDGQLLAMKQVLSASGARYRSENAAYELWNKGSDAFVSYGPEGSSDIILQDCTEGTTPPQ